MKNVVYFDPVFPALEAFFRETAGPDFELSFIDGAESAEREKAIRNADFFLAAAAKVTGSDIANAPDLKLIQKTGAGYDNIAVGEAAKRNIPVCNTPGFNATAVAELTMAHILALYRKLILLNDSCHHGNWPMWEHRLDSFEVAGKTHGIIGFGSIGKKVAELSKAFGTNVIHYDPLSAQSVSLEELLSMSDIITLHIPLTSSTRGLIGREQLKQMKRSAILVNMARGGIVDERALADALKNGRIAGAAADTLDGEPRIADNPLVAFHSFHCTPHVGAGTRDTLSKVLGISFSNMRRIMEGRDPEFRVYPKENLSI